MDISERITEVKEKFDLKNTDLAKIAGVSKSAVGLWVNHATTPSIDALDRIETKLGVSPKWIVSGSGQMMSKSAPEDHFFITLAEIARNLDDHDKESLLQSARHLAAKNLKLDL